MTNSRPVPSDLTATNLLAVKVPGVSDSPVKAVTKVGLPVKSPYAPENNVGLFNIAAGAVLESQSLWTCEDRYVLVSTDPSAFKNSDEVPPVFTNDPASNAAVSESNFKPALLLRAISAPVAFIANIGKQDGGY